MSELLYDGFDQPHEVQEGELAFGGNMKDLLPKWKSIPDEFWRGRGVIDDEVRVWKNFVSDWFFQGWPKDRELWTRADVDPELALRHLSAIMRSFAPKHEHKEAAVAWLMSRWYSEIRETVS